MPKHITQKSLKHYSDWWQLGPVVYDTCCDCGLTHKSEFKVDVNTTTKGVKLFQRTRRSVYKTVANRKKTRFKSKLRSLSSAAS